MKKYLKGLPLSLPMGSIVEADTVNEITGRLALPLSLAMGGIVEPFCFEKPTITALQKWLDSDQIEALRARAKTARNMLKADKNAPTLADERIVLQRAGELASALATILEHAPSRASEELDLVFQTYLGGWQQKEITQQRLSVLADSLEQRLDEIPTQDRRKSPVFFVSQIAEVLHAADIKTSVSESSRFFKICAIVFEAIGIYQSPAAPIRAYLQN